MMNKIKINDFIKKLNNNKINKGIIYYDNINNKVNYITNNGNKLSLLNDLCYELENDVRQDYDKHESIAFKTYKDYLFLATNWKTKRKQKK